MHCVLTADLAALLSQHGPAIQYRRQAVPPASLTQYWTSSRNRFDLWHQAMARYRAAEQSGDSIALRTWWRDHVVVLEEVLVCEMLTRVVAALAVGMESDSDRDELSPVTHAVHLSHLETRNRVQQIMLHGRGGSVSDAVRLNRLRRGVERWTDAMIGRMSLRSTRIMEYAFDRWRADEFRQEMRSYGQGAAWGTAAWLMNAAMHDTLQRRCSEQAALPVANREVAKSVLLLLRPDLFDSLGILKSLRLHRLEIGTDRSDRVISQPLSSTVDHAPTAEGLEESGGPDFGRWHL
jgi:hypothetical protein